MCPPPAISLGDEPEHMAKILTGQQPNVKCNPSLCHKLIWSMEHRRKVFIMDNQITVCSLHSLVTKNEAALDLYNVKSNRSQTDRVLVGPPLRPATQKWALQKTVS